MGSRGETGAALGVARGTQGVCWWLGGWGGFRRARPVLVLCVLAIRDRRSCGMWGGRVKWGFGVWCDRFGRVGMLRGGLGAWG